MPKETIICDICNGMKFILSNNEMGIRDLQRCDECNFFSDDSEAKAYVRTYIDNKKESNNA
jgi:hypothetical protein